MELAPAAVTTNRIAERAGYSVGTLYRHFANKEAIYGSIIAAHLETACETAESFEPMATVESTVRGLVDAAIESQRTQNPELWQALEQLPGARIPGGGFAAQREIARSRVVAAVRRLIGHHTPDATGEDLDMTAQLVVAALEGFGLAVSETTFNDPRFREHCSRMLTRYIEQ